MQTNSQTPQKHYKNKTHILFLINTKIYIFTYWSYWKVKSCFFIHYHC